MIVENYTSYEIDDSYNFTIMFNRIYQQYLEHGCLILALDLDDTVRPFRSESCKDTIATVKRCQNLLNCITIIYTANTNTQANIKFLNDNGIKYDSINCYPDNFPIKKFKNEFDIACESDGAPPKLYYNILLDDKSCGLEMACEILNKICDNIEEQKAKEKKNKLEGF